MPRDLPTRTRFLRLAACAVDLEAGRVWRGDGERALSATETALLRALAVRNGETVDRFALLEEVWGIDSDRVVTRALDTSVCRLRRKIEADASAPVSLLTVTGQGYRLRTEADARPAAGGDDLIGRVQALGWLEARWALGGAAALTGPPGIGKTRLARSFGARVSPAGAWFCEAADCELGAELLQSVAWSTGLPPAVLQPANDPDAAARRLGAGLNTLGPGLLILDGVERLLEPLERWLPIWRAAAPRLRLLLTSQSIPSLPCWRLAPLSLTESRALMAQRASLPAVEAALVAPLDGVPLAIELAAAQLSRLPAGALAPRLESGGLTLPPAEPGGATLRRTIRAAWSRLDEPERAALAAASVFEGGCPPRALAAITGRDDPGGADAIAGLLDALARRSLVERDGPDGRVRLLESVRAFAASRLSARDADGQVAARHARWYAGRAPAWVEATRGAAAVSALARLRREDANLRASWSRLEAAGDPDGAESLLARACLQRTAGVPGLLLSELSRAAALAQGRGRAELVSRVLHETAGHLRVLGRVDEALETARRAIALAAGDPALEAAGLQALGSLLRRRAPEQAEQPLRRAIRLADASGAARVAAEARASLGLVLLWRSRFDEAEALLDDADRRMTAMGDLRGRGQVWSHKVAATLRRGRLPETRAAAERALSLNRAAGNRALEVNTLLTLGRLALYQGALEPARQAFEEALDYYTRAGSRGSGAMALSQLALVDLEAGAHASALRRMRECAARYAGVDRGNEGQANAMLGLIALETGAPARGPLEAAVAAAREIGDPTDLVFSLALYATRITCAADAPASAARMAEAERLLEERLGDRPRGLLILARGLVEARAALVGPGDPDALSRALAAAWNASLLDARQEPPASVPRRSLRRRLERAIRALEDRAAEQSA